MTANGVFLVVQCLVSVLLLLFGTQLALLGGSPYYLIAGGALAITAWLGLRRSRWAVWPFAVLFCGTIPWALWESGLDGWALAPRLGLFTALGLWMLTPWYRARIGRSRRFSGDIALWVSVLLLVVGGLATVFVQDRLPSNSAGGIDYAQGNANIQGEWRHYGNTAGGSRFSPLTQITPENVGQLKPAWTYHTGPTEYDPKSMFEGTLTFQATPLKIGDRLFFCTGYNDVISLDAETGKEIWRYRPKVDDDVVFSKTCRGVAHYEVPNAGGFCSSRIYTATIDARLIALDAASGEPCLDFGQSGEVNLTQGMGYVEKGYYHATSPPAVIRGRLVLGGWVFDGQHTKEPPGVIRAFDAVTGQFSWAFDMGRPTEHGLPTEGESFTPGTPNSWSVMSADEDLGLVFVPTGNATPDYFGGHRTESDDKYSSSVIALNAETGEEVWKFQTTHHDLWDYDVASQPVLIDLPDGTKGLLQPTKRGEVFFLDRTTGRPIAEVEERPVPQGTVEEDWTSPTQPFSTGMPSFEGPLPTERDMWGITPMDQAYCRMKFRQARFEGTLTPVGTERPTIVWPGYLGGINWGSVSVDPVHQLMFVNSTHIAMYSRLVSREAADANGIEPVTRDKGKIGFDFAQAGTPYAVNVKPFMSLLGIPCQEPPYGLVSAVDLNTRKLLWQKPFGTARDSGPVLVPSRLPIPVGVPNLGGSVTTASGVTFIGATQERMIRAYATRTGNELWRARLPAGGHATPASYWSAKSNRQFIVIAAGGHGGLLSGKSDSLIAYALPKQSSPNE